MRLIDIEPLQKEHWHLHRHVAGVYAARVEEMELEEVPTVDAVPVIRCKDCINWDTDWTTHPPNHYCPAIDGFTSENFYCGYAEKMEEQDANNI